MPPPVRAAARFAIGYRPERGEDEALLAALYASTRGAEFAALGWPRETLAAFLDQQFRAQQSHYRALYPAAEWLIIEAAGAGLGRLALERRETSLHLIDVALLPERRGGGLGGAILADLIAEADALRLPVSLQVDRANPALRLYARLGFRAVEARPPYVLMERPAGTAA